MYSLFILLSSKGSRLHQLLPGSVTGEVGPRVLVQSISYHVGWYMNLPQNVVRKARHLLHSCSVTCTSDVVVRFSAIQTTVTADLR